ncbi:MAG: pyruvate, phosphate dikinase [Acidobacteriota bacterium]
MGYVYFFGEGHADGSAEMREILGGKGAGLAEMTNLGIDVPPGFTISTEVCDIYFKSRGELPDEIRSEILTNLARLESAMRRPLGSLLVSVRSGARASMPGMMDTILNLGLNDRTVRDLERQTGDARFAADCYRRFVQMYGDVVLDVPKASFEAILHAKKEEKKVRFDHELDAADLGAVLAAYKELVEKKTGQPFPSDPTEQLWGAIYAVFRSWNNDRAKQYRRLYDIPDNWGTAVNVQAMVFGNLGMDCATGVAFTRNPSTGEKAFYGEFLPNAQGEDVVAGIRTPMPLNAASAKGKPGATLEIEMPEVYAQLDNVRTRLERHYRDMQDIEFTVEHGKLYLLQTRTGKRTGFAALRIATEMVDEGIISPREALKRIDPEQLVQLLAPIFEPAAKAEAVKSGRALARGLNAGPGAACGRIALSAERAKEMAKRDRVILVRVETSPEDIGGMNAAQGILTARGGMTSHAAVVARGMGKPCVAGCGELAIDYDAGTVAAGGRVLREGDWMAIDGTTGEVIAGELQTHPSEVVQVLIDRTAAPSGSTVFQQWEELMRWADETRRLRVRTNADTPQDARAGRLFGAEGIGLCRTEHMFFDPSEPLRIRAMREMILADDEEGRRAALQKLLPFQRKDFAGIFREMKGLPVTVRLLDPPLHEFLPHEDAAVAEAAQDLGVSVDAVKARVAALFEFNPMLGHRGCRLGITYPEIYEMQAQAIIEAAIQVEKEEKVAVVPEIMIPLVGAQKELAILRERVETVARSVMEREGRELRVLVGTMIEVPRACLVADEIAEKADFFSFGTNDLTQMTFGFSRDDAGVFLQPYLQAGILEKEPFQTIDQKGIGQLVEMAVHKGRSVRLDLKIGVCGEHGGDPASVGFFHRAGLDYVSCSPYRVPIARVAAARAVIHEEEGEGLGSK